MMRYKHKFSLIHPNIFTKAKKPSKSLFSSLVLSIFLLNTFTQAQTCKLLTETYDYDKPLPFDNVQQLYSFNVSQIVTTTISEISCIHDFLIQYYTDLRCYQTVNSTLQQNLPTGYHSLIYTGAEETSKSALGRTRYIWSYVVKFSYDEFSENCVEEFSDIFNNIIQIGREMNNLWESSIPQSCTTVSSATPPRFEPTSQGNENYKIIATNLATICDHLDCSDSLPDHKLRCLNPIGINSCMSALCVPYCGPWDQFAIEYQNNDAYCENNATCSQTNTTLAPTCDCGATSTWAVYRTGELCQTTLYLWWFIVAGLMLIAIILIAISLCCCQKAMLAFFCCCCPCGPCEKCYRGCPQCGPGQCCEFEPYGGDQYIDQPSKPISGADLVQVQEVRNIESTIGDNRSFTADPSIITTPPTLYTRQRELAVIEQRKEELRKEEEKRRKREIVVELAENRQNQPTNDNQQKHENPPTNSSNKMAKIPKNKNKISAHNNLSSETTSLSGSTNTYNADTSSERGTENMIPILLPGYANAAYDPETTFIGNRVEVDAESYATTAEIRGLKSQRWVNPGSMAEARLNAKQPGEITYIREKLDSESSERVEPTLGKQNQYKAQANLNVSFTDVHIESSTETNFSENDEVPPLPQIGPRGHSNNNDLRQRAGWVPSIGPSPKVYLHPPIRNTLKPVDSDNDDRLSELTEMTVDGSVFQAPLSKRINHLSGGTIVETGDPSKRRYLDFSSVNVNFS